MRRNGVRGGLLLLTLMLGLVSCASLGGESSTASPSLYKRLGGREAIAGIVDDFVTLAVADPTIGPAFTSLPAPRVGVLKTNVADFICDAAGGPCSYAGRPMKDAHAGLKLTKTDVDACNAALLKALDKRNVGAREKDEVMKLVQSLMGDIVGQ